ncbi:MAG: alpha/beta hydrolase [Desulfobacterales bacterium]|nr:alpha/beta hydrolase [Desulfobacterales bacterium]
MIKIILWIIGIYLVYCCFLFIMQRQILFPRHLILEPSSRKESIPGIERIWLNTSFGRVETWLLTPFNRQDSNPFPVVIFGHGNGELIDYWPDELNKFNNFGLGVLLVEYPGYGRSEGTPSQKSISEAFEAAYDMLVSRPDVDHRIILFGRSVGGGAICDLAANRPSAALILMSTFTSTRSFAPKYLVPGFLIRDPFDNLKVVGSYTNPVLIIHGKFDEIIPYSHGETLYKASKIGEIIVYLSGHNDCPPDWDVFWKDIEIFLRKTIMR